MNKTVAVANFFIAQGLAHQVIDSCPPKINALCYFAHGWFLGITGKPLLDREFVATATGPELSDLTRMLRPFGNNQVTDLLRVMTPDPKVPGRSTKAAPIIPSNSPLQVILNKVWVGLGKVGVYTLNDVMCAPYSPWASSWYGASAPRGRAQKVIKDEAIQAWFQERKERIGTRMDLSLDSVKVASYRH